MGLRIEDLLALTPAQHRALKEVAEYGREQSMLMFQQLRADIHNSSEWMQRQDKQRWTAQDFGAPEPEDPEETPEDVVARQEWKKMQLMTATARRAGLHVVKNLRGTGQPIPKEA